MTATWRSRAAEAPARRSSTKPDLTVVRRQRQRRSLITRLGTVLLLSLFACVLGVVVFQTLRVQNQAKLDEIDDRIASAELHAKQLRIDLADAKAPDKIAEAARARLGMIQPGDVAYLQARADDEARAAWDPVKDPIPTTTVAAPPTTMPIAPAPKPAAPVGKAPTTTIKAPTSPVTTAKPTTPTTPAPKPTTPTTVAKPTTTMKPTATTTPTTVAR